MTRTPLKSAAELMHELEAGPWTDRAEVKGNVIGQICPLCAALVSSTSYHGRRVTDYRAIHIAWHVAERAMMLEAQGAQVIEVPDGRPAPHVASPGPVKRAAHDIGGKGSWE